MVLKGHIHDLNTLKYRKTQPRPIFAPKLSKVTSQKNILRHLQCFASSVWCLNYQKANKWLLQPNVMWWVLLASTSMWWATVSVKLLLKRWNICAYTVHVKLGHVKFLNFIYLGRSKVNRPFEAYSRAGELMLVVVAYVNMAVRLYWWR